MKKPAGVPAIGVGVAVSFRAGVRIGIYPETYEFTINIQLTNDNYI